MKYIKKFEKLASTDELERIGNYVITNPFLCSKLEKVFFNNTIGKIVGVSVNPVGNENSFKIEYNYEDIPSSVILNKDNTYYVHNYEIILEKKTKDDLEATIAAKKFNL